MSQCEREKYLTPIIGAANKEELDPAHDYADELFAQKFVWVTRRDATEDKRDYINLRSSDGDKRGWSGQNPTGRPITM